MELNNFRIEFGYEMIALYPYAYYQYLQGESIKIITNKGMKPFYFFAEVIEYHEKNRNWWYEGKTTGVELLYFQGCANAFIHKPELDLSCFAVPDLKALAKNDIYEKDSVYIANRYNNEWTINPELNRPINFFSLEVLDKIFKKLKNRQIYYFSTYGIKDFEDGTPQLQLNDYEFCQNYRNVTHIADICDINDSNSYNNEQLRILSNCTQAITMNGGSSILASYFPLKNLIYYKPVKLSNGGYAPKEHQTGDYNYYKQFNTKNSIKTVNSYEELLKNI